MFIYPTGIYIAIIGDIIGSKKLSDRNIIQKQLNETLNNVNIIYNKYISSIFMITLGDEFQGLLKYGSPICEIIDKIERDVYPIELRFGIGVGEITTTIDFNSSLGADGPAYYFARKVINDLKLNEKKKMMPKSSIGIEIENNITATALINSIFSQNTIIKSRWTKRQKEILNVLLNSNGTQNSVALKLGINQSNVQKAIQASGYYTYKHAQQVVDKVLMQISEVQDV